MTKVASHKSLLFALAISLVTGLTYVSGRSNPFVAEDFNMMAISTLDWEPLWRILTEEQRVKLLPVLLNRFTWSQTWTALRDWRTYGKYWPILGMLVAFLSLTFGGNRFTKLTSNRTYHFIGFGVEQARSLAAYLVYLVFPQIPLRSLDLTPLIIVLALCVALALSAAFIKGAPLIRFCVLWIAFALAPFVLFVPFGNADRYFYVSVVGFPVLIGLIGCWGYDRLKVRSVASARMAALLLMGLYLTSSLVLIQQRIGEWRRAGELAADVVGQAKRLYPAVSPESTMLFVALPDQYRQAYVFLVGGIGGAVYLAYGAQPSAPRAYRTRDPEVASFLKEAESVEHPLPGLYVFLYEDDALYDKSKMVNSPEPLRNGTWSR